MPGKYLEFIKSGRYVVPVELNFLPVTYTDVVTAKSVTTSKWMDKSHWKEMKTLLRPAVESVSKAHETGSGKVTTSHHVAHGVDVSFGFVIEATKDKCPFLAVLDPQINCWTDDEEEQDENVELDLGGRHQNLNPTDWYVKAVVIKRSFSSVDDAKKIRKELGIKQDDVRNFLSASNSEKKGTGEDKDKDSSNSKGDSSDDDDDDEDGRSTTETESLMEIPPPSGKVLQPTLPPNRLNSMGFVSLRPSCFRGSAARQADAIDEANLRRLYRQSSPPGDHGGFWNDEADDSDDEELPDIEEFSTAITYPKVRRAGTGKPRSPRKRGGSPYKHRCDTGLPDIDEGRKAGPRVAGGKRKRTVAIVEPMKPVNLDEMHSESRKRKGRNLTYSPTFGFGGRGGNSRNSAIEILQEDSELLPIPDYTPVFPSRRLEPPHPRRKRKKRVARPEAPTFRLSDEERRSQRGSDGSSEPEMPFLERMVSTSDEEQQLRAREEERRPLDSRAVLEEVIRLSQESTQVLSDVENNASSESEQDVTVSSPVKQKKRVKKRSKVVDDERNVRQLSPDMTTLGVQRVRRHFASDSDDITAESAYRKKPLKKRKKKKRIQPPPEKSPEPVRRTGDAQTQTVSSPIPDEEEESQETVKKTNEADETLIVVTKREREGTEYDSDFAIAAFSGSDNDDEVVFEGELQSNLYLPALGSPEEGVDALDLFSFETVVPNPLYSQEPPLIKLSPDATHDDDDNESIPLVPLFLDDDHSEIDFEAHISPHEDEEIVTETEPALDYTFDVADNLANRVKEKPIPDPILRRALQLNLSDDSDEHTEEPGETEGEGSIHSIPKNMSTFDLISNPNTLKASLGLLDQLKSTEPNQEEKDKELMPPPLIRRPSSPDICSLNPEERMKRPKLKKQGPPRKRPDSPQPGPSKPAYQVQDPLLREFLSRVDQVGNENDYEPAGDQFDLSQRSYYMLNVIPQYWTKSRMYKIHSKNVRDLSFSRIKEEFDKIKVEIRGIFEGSYHSERNLIFCKNTQDSIKALESMQLRFSPFENSQVGWLSSLINEFLVPQPGSRIKYVDYIRYVILPETCVRIYSQINGITLDLAEAEMKCGACYDQPLDS